MDRRLVFVLAAIVCLVGCAAPPAPPPAAKPHADEELHRLHEEARLRLMLAGIGLDPERLFCVARAAALSSDDAAYNQLLSRRTLEHVEAHFGMTLATITFSVPGRPGLRLHDAIKEGRYVGSVEQDGHLLLRFQVPGAPAVSQVVVVAEEAGATRSLRLSPCDQEGLGIAWRVPPPD